MRELGVVFSKVWKYKQINFFVFRIGTGFHAVNKFRSDVLCSPFQFNCGKWKSIWFYLPREYQLWSHWELPQHLVCWSNPLGVQASLWFMDHEKSLSISIFFNPMITIIVWNIDFSWFINANICTFDKEKVSRIHPLLLLTKRAVYLSNHGKVIQKNYVFLLVYLI